MGSIYKRGNSLWIKYYRAGKPYRESAKTSKESEARRLLKPREGHIAEGKVTGNNIKGRNRRGTVKIYSGAERVLEKSLYLQPVDWDVRHRPAA
jgi:hypothetical protein